MSRPKQRENLELDIGRKVLQGILYIGRDFMRANDGVEGRCEGHEYSLYLLGEVLR